MKVYGTNYDGKHRHIVAAESKAEAGRLFGISASHMRDDCCETGNDKECEIALSKPKTVFRKDHNDYENNNYVEFIRAKQ